MPFQDGFWQYAPHNAANHKARPLRANTGGVFITNTAYCVYLVECADNTLYCGCAVDPKRRVEAHNAAKGAKYTRSRLPVRLVYYESLPSRGDALRREYEIKRMPRRQKLQLISLSQIRP